jgi:hypothetical protein
MWKAEGAKATTGQREATGRAARGKDERPGAGLAVAVRARLDNVLSAELLIAAARSRAYAARS